MPRFWDSTMYKREFNTYILCEKCFKEFAEQENALRTKLIQQSQGIEFKTCVYCGTTRNLTQYPICPKCGAST